MLLVAAPNAPRAVVAERSGRPATRQWKPKAPTYVPHADGDAFQASVEELRLQPGSTVPGTRLEVEGWLGDGATSDVYRGRHVDLERKIAIKVLRELDASDDMRERFLAEARFISSLQSDYVVDVMDFGCLPDGRPYYAMEYLDGVTLDEALSHGPMPVRRAIKLLRMACKALQATHEAGIVHRDIKPGNLLIVRRPEGERLVLVDFGIAVIVGRSTEKIAGTPLTMAPEQIEGRPLDARADIYGLGCCAYEMLTGEPFAAGTTVNAILAYHLDPRRTATDPRHQIPTPLVDVIERCLAHDRRTRFASAAELEAALCRAHAEIVGSSAGASSEGPPVAEVRRSGIGVSLSGSRHRARLRLSLVAAAAVALAAFGLTGWVGERASAAGEDRFLVELTADHARAAADARHFVYPEPDSEGSNQTAYEDLVALEAWDGPARADALSQAARLRVDLGGVLLARGDSLWAHPSGRGPARESYAQALIFDPWLVRARERMSSTTGELAELRYETADARAPSVPRAVDALEAVVAGPPEPAVPTLRPDSSPSTRDTTVQVANRPSRAQRDARAARKLVRQAERKMAAGDRTHAHELYLAATHLDERNAEAYGGLADVHFQQGQHEQALRYATMAVRRAPRTALQHLRLADSNLRTGRPDRARDEYERAAALGSKVAGSRLVALGVHE